MMCRRFQSLRLALSLLPLIVVAFAPPADAGGLSFVEHEPGSGAVPLNFVQALAVSADGLNVYAASSLEDSVVVLTRNMTTGEVTFLETQEDDTAGVDGLRRVVDVAVSPNGSCVYAVGQFDDKVAAFSRNLVTGALTFVQAVEDGVGGVTGLNAPEAVAVSPDNLHVYVTGKAPGVATVVAFSSSVGCTLTYIETETGGATELGGSGEALAISADGNHVYVGGTFAGDGVINLLTRNAVTGTLTFLGRTSGVPHLTSYPNTMTISPDGKSVYASHGGDNAVVVFSRDTGSGNLTFVEFQKHDSTNPTLANPNALVVSPDNAYLYVACHDDDSVSVFRRNTETGALRFLEIQQDPLVDPPNNVLGSLRTAAVSPAGDHLYVGFKGITVLAVDSCGDGHIGPDEHCDDGNVIDGDGCSSSCRLDLCGAAPTVGCRGTAPLGAKLQLKNLSPDRLDKLQWKWSKGDATTLAEYGDPLTSASYLICLYDGSANPQPLFTAAAPADGTCKKGKPCWKAAATSYKYNDGLLLPDGLQIVQLKQGLANGKAGIQVKGKGANLVLPALPLTLPVTVQMKNTETGVCWEAVYVTADTNDGEQLKAKGD